ncbi:MAG: hypothetical protein LJE96_06435 [Deltaproteobacteria bacterium]|nr:hypothetical protein [Deltaproteobacteria bacterium]
MVTTDWLAKHMNDPNVRILDRQDIFPKDDFYSKGHIPNSIRMPTSAIKGMKVDVQEMLILKDLVKFLEEKGVSPDDHIVLVGWSKRLPATTHVFWALDVLGYKKMSILDGGIDKWKAENRQVTKKEFKSAKEIQAIFASKGLTPDKHLSFTSVRGCFGTVDYFAARLLNYPNVSVYDGAWIEEINATTLWKQDRHPRPRHQLRTPK